VGTAHTLHPAHPCQQWLVVGDRVSGDAPLKRGESVMMREVASGLEMPMTFVGVELRAAGPVYFFTDFARKRLMYVPEALLSYIYVDGSKANPIADPRLCGIVPAAEVVVDNDSRSWMPKSMKGFLLAIADILARKTHNLTGPLAALAAPGAFNAFANQIFEANLVPPRNLWSTSLPHGSSPALVTELAKLGVHVTQTVSTSQLWDAGVLANALFRNGRAIVAYRARLDRRPVLSIDESGLQFGGGLDLVPSPMPSDPQEAERQELNFILVTGSIEFENHFYYVLSNSYSGRTQLLRDDELRVRDGDPLFIWSVKTNEEQQAEPTVTVERSPIGGDEGALGAADDLARPGLFDPPVPRPNSSATSGTWGRRTNIVGSEGLEVAPSGAGPVSGGRARPTPAPRQPARPTPLRPAPVVRPNAPSPGPFGPGRLEPRRSIVGNEGLTDARRSMP